MARSDQEYWWIWRHEASFIGCFSLSLPRPGPLPEPFGDDIFAALAHLHPVVDGVGVGVPVLAHIVPREQFAGFGLVQFSRAQKARCAAGFGFVEVDHDRPAALPRDAAIFFPVHPAGFEIVRVRFEFLTHVIDLALNRFAIGQGDAGEIVEPLIECDDDGVAMVKVACAAGAERIVAIGIGDGRGFEVAVDARDQVGACGGGHESRQDELHQLGRRRSADAGDRRQPCRRARSARRSEVGRGMRSGHGRRFSAPLAREQCLTKGRIRAYRAPSVATIAQLVRAPVCGTGGRGFEPRWSPHFPRVTHSRYCFIARSRNFLSRATGASDDGGVGLSRFR